jgi:4-hydroxythreonine-4-phosphate dehydrogenase
MSEPIAVTLGDPRGIGPEVAVRAAESFLRETTAPRLVFVGPRGAVCPEGVELEEVGSWDGTREGAARVAAESLRRAAAMACGGQASAVVTAPVHKPTLRLAGLEGAGQTEILQALVGAKTVGMLMAAEETRFGAPLRVLLATRHVALRDAPRLLTEELLVEQTALLAQALERRWGIAAPRLALCALNPHASDGGLFGDEEARVYEPAVRRSREAGVRVQGPLPADTVFSRALEREFDAVVAPYHDVGMAAFKTVTFGSGVNVTLGLPFVRTSPDHGTAFELVGTGRARPDSMLEALRLAHRLTLYTG